MSPRAVTILVMLDGTDLDARPCFEAILSELKGPERLFVVDCGSQDHHLLETLEDLQNHRRLSLERLEQGRGLAHAVSLAHKRFPEDDVAVVSAAVTVPRGWLSRLRAVLAQNPTAGTVSALSNAASPMQYPKAPCPVFTQDQAETASFAAERLGGAVIEIPVTGSSCVLIRSECLSDSWPNVASSDISCIANFSSEATRRGWLHTIATSVFAHFVSPHVWAAKETAEDDSEKWADLRVDPVLSKHIDSFVHRDPLRALRRQLDEAQLECINDPMILVLTHARGGGVDRFVAERCASLRRDGFLPLICRAHEREHGPAMLWTERFPANDLIYEPGEDSLNLLKLLRKLPIHRIELQHFLGLAPDVVESCLAMGVPYDVFVHDYIWICPRVTLIGGDGQYCGEPRSTRICNQCVRQLGAEIGEPIGTKDLRRRSERWLCSARKVFVPTQDVALRLSRYFPKTSFTVQALEPPRTAPVKNPRRKLPVRVGLIGSLGRHKGYDVLLRCARYVQHHDLPVHFVLVGFSLNDDELVRTGCVSITGPYSDFEVGHLLEREALDVIWLPSVWPETWSYTLTHAISTGLPVVAYALGAIAERIRVSRCGILCPLNTSTRNLVNTLMDAALNPSPHPLD